VTVFKAVRRKDINFVIKSMPDVRAFLQKMIKNFVKTNKLFRVTGIILGLVLSMVALPVDSFPEELPAIEDIVQKLQMSYETTKDLSADFIQEINVKSIARTEIEEGKVFFKNPQNMLWNYTKPSGKKLVIRRNTAWLYLPQEKVAYRQNAGSIFQSRLLIDFFAGAGKLNSDFIITYARPNAVNEEGNYLLILTPRRKNTSFNVLKLTIDKKKFHIVRLSFDDAFGNSTVLKFSGIQFNAGLAEKLFQFKPPAGVQIFEMP